MIWKLKFKSVTTPPASGGHPSFFEEGSFKRSFRVLAFAKNSRKLLPLDKGRCHKRSEVTVGLELAEGVTERLAIFKSDDIISRIQWLKVIFILCATLMDNPDTRIISTF